MANKNFIARHGLEVANGLFTANNGKAGVNTSSLTVTFEVNSNDAVRLPSGNTGQRPSGANGYIRINTETSELEYYQGSSWKGSSIGGSNTQVLYNNSGSTSGITALTWNNSSGALTLNPTSFVMSATTTYDRSHHASTVLSDGATINWDANDGRIAIITLGGNRTMNLPTNLKVGTYILYVIQDGTGSRTLSWHSSYKFPAGVAPVLTTTAYAIDICSFVSDGTWLYGTYIPDVR